MSYIVSARKYRPQKFEDVVGQEHITSTLKNALLSDKLAHAFLFCGPRGVGKTTCARLLAKVINMKDPKAAIVDGSYADTQIDISMNIVELDAASNNTVEHMRSLIEQVRFQPQQGKYKVFIIDEVHMLTTSAFNAFLKTLEEPPPYAIFILATTEKHKILPTIMSRCQLYDFRRIMVPDIIKQLEAISLQEGTSTEYDALYTIAEKADGAMRDALSIYDRIASASNNSITYKSVIENLNLLDYDYFFRATDLLLREDGPNLLLLLEEVLANGFEGDTFMNGLSKHLRNLMYCKQEPTQRLMQLSDALKEKYMEQSNHITYSTILTALSLSNDCDINYAKAKDKRLHIEIALLKICYASRQIEPDHTISDQKKNTEPQITNPTSTSLDPIPPTPTIPSAPSEDKPNEIERGGPISIEKEEVKKSIDRPSITVKDTKIESPHISSIDALISQAQEEINNKTNSQKELNIDEVNTIWMEYARQQESPTSSSILKNVKLSIEDKKIIGSVPSTIAKEEIQQETGLYSILRDHFNQNDLNIEINVNRELFPDSEIKVEKKLYTAKEKYDHLIKINPLLDDLIDTLRLQPDQD